MTENALSIEEKPELGLTIFCCPDFGLDFSAEPVRLKTWNERMNEYKPTKRLMSVGIDIVSENSENLELLSFQNRLIATNSIDAFYHIYSKNIEKRKEALEQVRICIYPFISDSQLIWWGDDGKTLMPQQFKFARILKLSPGLSWLPKLLTLFSHDENSVEISRPIITENDIINSLDSMTNISGKGEELSLFRPIKFALTVQTLPVNANVNIGNIENDYHDGIVLEPGSYWLTVNYEGYQNYNGWISLEKENQTIEIVLNKDITKNDSQNNTKSIILESKSAGFYSPEGNYFAALSHGNRLIMYDSNYRELATIQNLTYAGAIWGSCLTFSPDEKLVAFRRKEKANDVVIANVPNLQIEHILTNHTDFVNSVSFNSNGMLLATGSDDNSIKIWKRISRNTIEDYQTLKGHFDDVKSVSFSPDDHYLASGGRDNSVIIWKLKSGKYSKMKSLSGHTRSVYCLSFSLDGKYLASGSLDSSVRIWNFSSASWRYTQTLQRSSSAILCLSFSHDSKYLAFGKANNTIEIWKFSLNSFIHLKTLKGHSDRVISVSFSQDSKYLASGSYDHTIKIWEMAGFEDN